MTTPTPTKDLPTSTKRALHLSVALEELGITPNTVFSWDLFTETLTLIVGSQRNQLIDFRKELRTLGIFTIHPEETRGKGQNFAIYQGPPPHLTKRLPDDAQPQPPKEPHA